MPASRRVVVVGGGHNGLVASAYLARAGVDTVLVERRSRLGGVVGSFDYFPGYRAAITNSPGSFESRVMVELELERHGLRFHRPSITVAQRFGDRTFLGFRDRDRIAAQIEAFAEGEYHRYRQLIDDLNSVGAASGLSVWRAPDSIDRVRERLGAGAKRELFDRVISGSLMDLLDDRLRSSQAKALLMMLALPGTRQSPRDPGSALGLLLRPISMASLRPDEDSTAVNLPLRGSVGTPIGSMSAIIDALERSAVAAGARILRDRSVERILTEDGRVSGVRLGDGEEIPADAVLSTIEPSLLQHDLLEDPDDLVPGRSVEPPQGGAFKLALALDGLPTVPGLPEDVSAAQVLESQIRIGSSPEHIESAIEAGIAGDVSDRPIMWGMVPSLASPELAPPGTHLFSVNVWHAPYSLGESYWTTHRDAFAQRCIAQLDEQLPGLRDRITDVRALSPFDLEQEFSLTGSNITHGEMTVDRFFDRRPLAGLSQGKAALSGLYLGGSGSWPGGYVTGAPGRNAAHSIVHDLALSSSTAA